MVEVKNVEVFGLNRAVNAINNSFNVGEIDTTIEVPEKRWGTAKSLGNNMDPHQSHDAFLKGTLVTFDLKGNGVFMPELQRYHFLELVMSQSTQHSMKKFMESDYDPFTKYVTDETKALVKKYYNQWVAAQKNFTDWSGEANNKEDQKTRQQLQWDVYEAFERLVHNLPRGLELWVTCTTNYLQLKTIVIQRAKHKQVEDWGSFIEFCYSLPRFRELCGFKDSKWDLENLFPLVYKK